jgi:hypothetical protein
LRGILCVRWIFQDREECDVSAALVRPGQLMEQLAFAREDSLNQIPFFVPAIFYRFTEHMRFLVLHRS